MNLNTFTNEIIPKLNNFSDFYGLVNGYRNKEKGDFFEYVIKYIFIFHPFYKNITKNIWLYNEIPLVISKYLNIPEKDKGIDLVLNTKDNKYFAVQCKFRSNKNDKINWGNLGTFVGMTFGVSDKFDGAIYATNIYDIDEEIQKCKRVIVINESIIESLDVSFFDQVRDLINKTNKYKPRLPLEKRDYQKEFIEKCDNYFKNNDEGFGNICCGSGKTLMSYWVHQKLKPRYTLIAVPSLYLLTQFFKEWFYEAEADKQDMEFVLVGSNADIEDELYQNNGLILTTNEMELYTQLVINKINSKKNLVIITTYQSCDKLIFGSNILKITYELCIIDEAHKTCQINESQFTLLLNNKHLRINKRLFLTATPKIYNNPGETNENVISMDNKKIYGEEIFKYTIRKGINDRYLSDYNILTQITENNYINEFLTNNKLLSLEQINKIDSHYLGTAVMIIKAMQNHDCTHMVTYHNTINNSKMMEKLLNMLTEKLNHDIKIIQLDGTLSINKRNKLIDVFKKTDKCVMTTARVLNEGINIPVIDSLCFVDLRASTIDIIQCIGRSLRLYDGKQLAKILVPYIFTDINSLKNNYYFPKLVNIIKSLSQSDECMYEYFSLKNNGKTINKKIISYHYYISDTLVQDVSVEAKLNDWISNLEINVWKRLNMFDYMYNKLKEFVEKNNKYPSQVAKDDEELKLHHWMMSRKREKRIGILSQERIEKLENIPNFKWDSLESFDDKYNKLLEFIVKNNKLPSEWSKNKEEIKLATWCRRLRKEKRINQLSDEKIQKLEKISIWFWDKEDPFEKRYNELVDWIQKNKKIPSINSKDKKEKELGAYCVKMRQLQKKHKLKLEKEQKLNELEGWFWCKDTDVKKFQTMDEKYNDIKKWMDINNKIPTENSKDEEEARLGRLCNKIRARYRDGKISQDNIKLFEALPNWFWKRDANTKPFDENFEELEEWLQEHKQMPSRYSEDNYEKQLGIWCEKIKELKRRNKLDDDNYNKLIELPFWNKYERRQFPVK